MFHRTFLGELLAGVLFPTLAAFATDLTAGDKKAEKDKKEELRKGGVIGLITGKGENFVEVKADGEEKGRKYVPHWRDGGLDKDMLKQIAKLTVGSRVRLDWEFDERARVVKVEVLKAAEGKDSKSEEKKKDGAEKKKLVGVLTAKSDKSIELKADGEEKARQYFFMGGAANKELRKALEDIPTGTRAVIEWTFLERNRVLSIEPLRKSSDK
jgi:hypothetical protein